MEGALSCPSVEGALSNCARPGSHPKGNCSQQDCQDAVGRGGGLGGTQEPGSCCCRCHVPGGWRAQVHLLEGFLTPNPALRELVEGRQACQGAGRWGAPTDPLRPEALPVPVPGPQSGGCEGMHTLRGQGACGQVGRGRASPRRPPCKGWSPCRRRC